MDPVKDSNPYKNLVLDKGSIKATFKSIGKRWIFQQMVLQQVEIIQGRSNGIHTLHFVPK